MADDTDPRLTKLVASLPAAIPFVGPETQERNKGAPFKARLGANENGFGASPKAIAAMQAAAPEAWMYGDPEAYDLRHAIADLNQVDAAHVMVGEGIDGLLGLLVRLLIEQGDAVVTSDGAYPTFNYHVAGFGGVLHKVPYSGNFEDPSRLISKTREVGAKLIYIANPDNPMGSHHDAAAMEKMIRSVPDGCLLILDEAYIDLGPPETSPKVDPDDPRVIIMRTFSKAHGLAGARVGYALGSKPLIAAFDRVRNHFGVNRIAQAGALAALQDEDWLDTIRDKVARCRDKIAAIALKNGLTPLPSATNFVTIDCGQDGDFARAVLAELNVQGIFVRMPFVAPNDRCIRVSCGPDAEIEAFAKALPVALAEVRDLSQT